MTGEASARHPRPAVGDQRARTADPGTPHLARIAGHGSRIQPGDHLGGRHQVPDRTFRFLVDPEVLRTTLVEVGCFELPITSAHAAAVAHLPPIHKDPFDRILIAQAQVEGITLLTADRTVARYPGPIRLLERQADR